MLRFEPLSGAGEKMALNIFEPRYRLMVRRCMEGSRRLGMAIVSTGTGAHTIIPTKIWL